MKSIALLSLALAGASGTAHAQCGMYEIFLTSGAAGSSQTTIPCGTHLGDLEKNGFKLSLSRAGKPIAYKIQCKADKYGYDCFATFAGMEKDVFFYFGPSVCDPSVCHLVRKLPDFGIKIDNLAQGCK